MSQEFITAATGIGAIVMLWALCTRDGVDESAKETLRTNETRILTKVVFEDRKSAEAFTMAKALKHLQDSLGKYGDHYYSLF